MFLSELTDPGINPLDVLNRRAVLLFFLCLFFLLFCLCLGFQFLLFPVCISASKGTERLAAFSI